MKKEEVTSLLIYLLGDVIIGWLFYHSVIAILVLLPGAYFFLRMRKQEKRKREKKELEHGFLLGMRYVATSLSAGYSVENAFMEATKELEKVSEENSLALIEFRTIVNGLSLNLSLEELLMNLARKSHIEDIRTFAEVFTAAKRTGGDLVAIIQSTIAVVMRKEETEREIEVVLTAKKMEQNIMSLIPCLLMSYVTLTSPGFFDSLYGNLMGVIIMSICLAVYLAAVLLGRKIVQIEV